MKSLKSRFGKFAVSTEKMAMVTGGGDLQCYKNGAKYGPPVTLEAAVVMVSNGFADTCSQ